MIGLKWIYAASVLLGYGLFCAFFTLRYRHHEAVLKAQVDSFLDLSTDATDSTVPCVVAYASQTGQAEELAFQNARFLHDAGESVKLLSLGELTAEALQQCKRLVCIASTYGEGDAPDSAAPFASRVMQDEQLNLEGLEFAVLALGDRSYQHFCGFGHALAGYLKSRGARPMFDLVEVDSSERQSESKAFAQWQKSLGGAMDKELETGSAQWQAHAVFSPWLVRARQHLNPHSMGGEVHHLELVPADGVALPHWQAGDLVQLEVPGLPDMLGAPGVFRDYSIASIPEDGAVHLLVRLVLREDGSPGLASGWLTQRAVLNDRVALRIRTHRTFRIADNADRPLILIGNGTGLAGLRAHLRARFHGENRKQGDKVSPTWLIFGERQEQHDSHYREEINSWFEQGLLTRMDRVFSRDQAQRKYVQHVLAESAHALQEWINKGAAIYVCGSLKGMAGEVDLQLKQILGEEALVQLAFNGRYRRDVY